MMKITATLLIFSSVLWVKAIPGIFHKDSNVCGCTDPDENPEKEDMFALDGEVKWYADFSKGEGETPQPTFIEQMTYPDTYLHALTRQDICRNNLRLTRAALNNPPLEQDKPHSTVYTKHEVELGVDNVLICRVSGFYPAPVHISWTRNNLNLTSNISSSVPHIKEDRTFYQFSSLKFTPEQGDVYSCRVNHQSLTEPLARVWDVDQFQVQSSVGPDVFCGVGLTLGLLGVAMGTFFLIKGNECT